MAGRSKITRKDPKIQSRVGQLHRQGATQREIAGIVNAEFPDAELSKSGVGRYVLSLRELTERMRDIDQAAKALVGEFGDSLGEKASTLLANSVITLVTDASLKQQNEEVDIEQIRKLARAAKDAIDTKRMDVNVRRAIAQEARDALLREQQERLDKVVRTGGLSAETAADMRKKILGIG